MALKKAVSSDSGDVARFKFEKKGDRINGYYIRTEVIQIEGKDVKKHIFSTSDGLVSVLGQANLEKQLLENNCKNVYVEAVFTGQVQKLKGGRTMKLYDLSFDDEDKYSGPTTAEEEVAEEYVTLGSEDSEEDSLEDEAPLDEVQPQRQAPARTAAPVDAARKAKMDALMKSRLPARKA